MSGKKSNGVLPLKTTDNPDRELDVIFVHGLGGDADSTWRSAENKDHFWPDWLAENFEMIRVWVIDYGAHPSRWFDDVMSMEDRALNLLNDMSIKHIGHKPIGINCCVNW